MRSTLGLLAFVVACLFSCRSAAPRTSLFEEREGAYATLDLVEVGLIAWDRAGKPRPGEYDNGVATLAELRKLVQDSETVPTSWSSIMRRVTLLGARWIPAKN